MRSGSSTNHIPILRVLLGPTTHSRECLSGARNSMSPSPTVTIAKTSIPDYSRSLTSLMNKGNVVLRGWSQCAGC